MNELFTTSNKILPYVLVARSTKVFVSQLFMGGVMGAMLGGVLYTIYYLFKNRKKKK